MRTRKATSIITFLTKAGLVEAIVAEHNRSLRATMEEMDNTLPHPWDRLEAYVRHWGGSASAATQIHFALSLCSRLSFRLYASRYQLVAIQHFRELEEW